MRGDGQDYTKTCRGSHAKSAVLAKRTPSDCEASEARYDGLPKRADPLASGDLAASVEVVGEVVDVLGDFIEQFGEGGGGGAGPDAGGVAGPDDAGADDPDGAVLALFGFVVVIVRIVVETVEEEFVAGILEEIQQCGTGAMSQMSSMAVAANSRVFPILMLFLSWMGPKKRSEPASGFERRNLVVGQLGEKIALALGEATAVLKDEAEKEVGLLLGKIHDFAHSLPSSVVAPTNGCKKYYRG